MINKKTYWIILLIISTSCNQQDCCKNIWRKYDSVLEINSQLEKFRDEKSQNALHYFFQNNKPVHTIELVDLTDSLVPSKQHPQQSWYRFAYNDAPVYWLHSGLMENKNGFIRKGKALITIKGKYLTELHQILEPSLWNIEMTGSSMGPNKIEISSNIISPDLDQLDIPELFKGKAKAERIHVPNDYWYIETWKLTFENRKSVVLKYEYSCGSMGCVGSFEVRYK